MSSTAGAVCEVGVTHPRDAPPFARALAQQISLLVHTDVGRQQLTTFHGVVGVRSSSDPQKATVRSGEQRIEVTHGIAADVHLEVTVDPGRRDVVLSHRGITGGGPSLAAVEALLSPVLPCWHELADSFWAAAQSVPGMPSLRLVECDESENLIRELVLGDSVHVYEIWGSAGALARLVAGLDFFADAVFAGDLKIRGSFSDFSVVSGASMKVMWHV